MQKLHPHNSNKSSVYSPSVQWTILESSIEFTFEVLSGVLSEDKFYTSDVFGIDHKRNTNLWDFDVVEIFIHRGGQSYLELQVSPLGQPFSYIIKKPRVECKIPEVFPASFTTSIQGNQRNKLICKLEIPFANIPGHSDTLKGGCFACLGKMTEYYSLNPNIEDTPDYHRPDLFIDFGVIQ